MAKVAVGHKEAIVVIDDQTVDERKMSFFAVADEFCVLGFGIEDENASDLLIPHVNKSLRIDGHAEGPHQLRRKMPLSFALLLRSASHLVHPAMLLYFLLGCQLGAVQFAKIPDTRDFRSGWKLQLGVVHLLGLRRRRFRFFLLLRRDR